MEPHSTSLSRNNSPMILRIFALILLFGSKLFATEPPKSAKKALEEFFPPAAGKITLIESAQSAGVWYLYVNQEDSESASQVIFAYADGKLRVVYGDYPMFLPEPPAALTSALPREVLRDFIKAWAQRQMVKVGAAKFEAETKAATGITAEVLKSLR